MASVVELQRGRGGWVKERELGLGLAEMGAAERAEEWYYRWIWRAWFGSVDDGLWRPVMGLLGQLSEIGKGRWGSAVGGLCGCGGELEGWCCGRGKNGLGFRERERRPGSVGGGEGEVETTSERGESGWTALPSYGLGELAASSGGKVWCGRRRWGRLWLGHGERQLEEGSGLALFFCGFLIYFFSKLSLLCVVWLLFINRILLGLNCSSISFFFF